ncbi:unnamed protein product, partial [marine sediment metagenome]
MGFLERLLEWMQIIHGPEVFNSANFMPISLNGEHQ